MARLESDLKPHPSHQTKPYDERKLDEDREDRGFQYRARRAPSCQIEFSIGTAARVSSHGSPHPNASRWREGTNRMRVEAGKRWLHFREGKLNYGPLRAFPVPLSSGFPVIAVHYRP